MVVKNDLTKFLDMKKVDTRLIGDIERHLMRRPEDSRDSTVLHPSEMIKADWCYKYSYYLLNGGEKKTKKPALFLQVIFDEGHFIHSKWQTWFQEMGVLFGNFKCDACEHTTWGVSPNCEKCNSARVRYSEVTLFDDSLMIKGHTDGWIKGIGNDCLIEIKSIGPGTIRFEAPELIYDAGGDVEKAWKNIRRPFRSHVLQGQMYLELAKRMYGSDAPTELVFLYELKLDQKYKEFVVKSDFDIVERFFIAAEKVVQAVKDQVEPRCNINPDGCNFCLSIGDPC